MPMVPLRFTTTTQHRLSIRLPLQRPNLQRLHLRRRTRHISIHHMQDMGEVNSIVEQAEEHTRPEGVAALRLTITPSQNVAGEV